MGFCFCCLVQFVLKLVIFKVSFCRAKSDIFILQAMIKAWEKVLKGGARTSSPEHLRQQIVLVLQCTSSNVPILSDAPVNRIFLARDM